MAPVPSDHGARAQQGQDVIFSPIAQQLRARAAVYRAKGMPDYADELEREAADAEFIAKAFGGPTPPTFRSNRLRTAKATTVRSTTKGNA